MFDTKMFIDLFDFEPGLIGERQCKKKVLDKLMVLATKLKNKEDTLGWQRSKYSTTIHNLSKDYSNMLEIIKDFDPEFGSKIPAWRQLPKFVETWLKSEL